MADNVDFAQLRHQAVLAFQRGRFLESLQAMGPILESDRADAEDCLFTGKILTLVREYAQACMVLREGLRLKPGHAEIEYEIARAQFQLGDVPAATHEFERLAREHSWPQVWSALATIIPGCPTADNARILAIRRRFAEEWTRRPEAFPSAPAGHRAKSEEDSPTTKTERARSRRIRLGYISAFFHRANYMKPVWGLIDGHDRKAFDIELFADDCRIDQFDWFHTGPHDHIHITTQMDNAALVELLKQRSLDIVIDLNAFSDVPRLGLYLQRLAPQVVAWFNWYATSALPGIDWIVGDQYVIPIDEEATYTERVHRLPGSYLAFAVGHRAPEVKPPPCLANDLFTYGSLVSQYKITPQVLDAWSEILLRVEKSRLLLANRAMQATMNREYLANEFAKRGVPENRLKLMPPAEHFEYLRYYDQIDLALDAFPYNGGTTTTEAIWQGVPVLAFDGDRWAARTSRTLLMNCHLSEFVAPHLRAWIELAVRWGSDKSSPRRLQEIRSTMRERLLQSDVCQMPSMVRAMEDFYLSIARK